MGRSSNLEKIGASFDPKLIKTKLRFAKHDTCNDATLSV